VLFFNTHRHSVDVICWIHAGFEKPCLLTAAEFHIHRKSIDRNKEMYKCATLYSDDAGHNGVLFNFGMGKSSCSFGCYL